MCRSGQSAFRFALFESAYHGNIVVLLYTPVPWGAVTRSAVCTESCTKFTDSCSARQKSHGTCKQPGMMPYPLDINRTRCKCGKSLPGLFDIVTNFGPIRPQVSSRYIASQSLTVLPEFYRYSILSVYSNPRPPLLVAGPAPRATRHGGRGSGARPHRTRCQTATLALPNALEANFGHGHAHEKHEGYCFICYFGVRSCGSA